MSHYKKIIFAGFLLAGCAQIHKPLVLSESKDHSTITGDETHHDPSSLTSPEDKGESHVKQALDGDAAVKDVKPAFPEIELSEDILYQYLLTELAAQRGYDELAAESGAELAQDTHDPRLAKRAAQLALAAGNMNKTIEAIRFWQETDPADNMATHMLSAILLRGGKLDEARVEIAKLLKTDNAGLTFMQFYPLLAAYPDKAAVLHMMQQLSSDYPAVPEAHWVIAKLAAIAGDEKLAFNEVHKAQELKPEWDEPVLLEAMLLHKTDPLQMLDLLHRYLLKNPKADKLRLHYARALLEQKQYQAALSEFKILSDAHPESSEFAFAIGLVSLELNDISGAEYALERARSVEGRGHDEIEFFLGELNEVKKDWPSALTHYHAVETGDYHFPAQMRIVYLLNKQGKLNEARKQLQQVEVVTQTQKVLLVMTEAQLLSDANKYAQAYQVLQSALIKFPDQPDLLYQFSLLAEKLHHYDESEKQLRKLIKIKPEDADAYNALGYSLLERNVRNAEAVALVEKALALSPDDPAIMDSVGWGYYRIGSFEKSVTMLKKSFAANPDPEIAAHLGEVLWVKGDKKEATGIWQDSLHAHPDNVLLQAVMKRYLP
jgi:Flp pilus assembly protein TadD